MLQDQLNHESRNPDAYAHGIFSSFEQVDRASATLQGTSGANRIYNRSRSVSVCDPRMRESRCPCL